MTSSSNASRRRRSASVAGVTGGRAPRRPTSVGREHRAAELCDAGVGGRGVSEQVVGEASSVDSRTLGIRRGVGRSPQARRG